MFKHWLRVFHTLVLAAVCAGPALGFEPATGMWGVDGEVNGKPGRGFQLDAQAGPLLVFSYFGYRADGSSMFLQASGTKVNNVFVADLREFKGGTSLGGAQRDGAAAGSPGQVTLAFDSPTTGTLTLPGEAAKRISRVQFEDHSARFNNLFNVALSYEEWSDVYTGTMKMAAKDGVFSMTLTAYNRTGVGSDQVCTLAGNYALANKGIVSTGTMSCSASKATLPSTTTYRTEDLEVDGYGSISGRIYFNSLPPVTARDGRIFISGLCVHTGFITLGIPRCSAAELDHSSTPGPGPW